MRVNDKWAVSPGVIKRYQIRGLLPDVCLWENARTFLLLWEQGRCPISVVRLAAPRAALDSAPCTGLGCHIVEVKLIVSLINLIPQHLLKGFTAC